MRRLIVLVALFACKDREVPHPVPISPPAVALGGSDTVGVLARKPAPSDRIAPTHAVAWKHPTGAASPAEDAIWGTWVASVGEYATRSLFMADRTAFSLPAGGDIVSAIGSAIANDTKLATNCVWLEFNTDHTGIRRECALVNGEASALDQNDPITGAKKDLGTRFEWYFDNAKPSVKILFAEAMVAPVLRDGKMRQLEFRQWTLNIGAQVGENKFSVKETLPEHDYVLPAQYAYEMFPHKFIGK